MYCTLHLLSIALPLCHTLLITFSTYQNQCNNLWSILWENSLRITTLLHTSSLPTTSRSITPTIFSSTSFRAHSLFVSQQSLPPPVSDAHTQLVQLFPHTYIFLHLNLIVYPSTHTVKLDTLVLSTVHFSITMLIYTFEYPSTNIIDISNLYKN